MHLPTLATLALAAIGALVTPAAATQRLAKPDSPALVTRIADLDGPAMGSHRRKGRIHRYRRTFGYWRTHRHHIRPSPSLFPWRDRLQVFAGRLLLAPRRALDEIVPDGSTGRSPH